MPMDWSKLSDQELLENAPNFGNSNSKIQTSSNPSIEMASGNIEADPRNVVFTSASGVTNRPGLLAEELTKNQAKIDLQQQQIPLDVQAHISKLKGEKEETRKEFGKSLKTFLMYDEMIPRGEGLVGRQLEGLDSMLSGWTQTGERGKAVKMHHDMRDSIKTPLAKLLGNMGNLTDQEQQAAKVMLTDIFESEDVTLAKRAFLVQLATGLEMDSPKDVKRVIRSFMGSQAFDKERFSSKYNEKKQTNLDDIFGQDEDVSKVSF
jgi:hypothetical protein